MVGFSNTYSFGQNTQLDDLFREAYERIGIIGNEQDPLHIMSALMSGNLELSSWPGKGLNLWMVRRQMLSLYPSQPIYSLPLNTVRILEVVVTQPIRLNTGGTAFSTHGGIPANCFDPNETAGCTQNAPNGSIGYDYGNGNQNSILYVGIKPLASSTYTLKVEYSFTGAGGSYTEVYTAPEQQYPSNQISWFVIENSLNARFWRITETGGETLAIQQIYFNQPATFGTGDRLLSPLSRSDYMSIATKMNTGFPSGYYFDQTMSPNIVLWPTPPASSTQTNLLYTSYRYVQDISQMWQAVEVPQRFYDALVSGLAARLAMKFAPDRYQLMKMAAMEAYEIAAATDFENVPLRFDPDLTQYSG